MLLKFSISKKTIITLIVGLACSLLIFSISYSYQKKLWENEFKIQSQDTVLGFKNIIELNERILLDIRSLFIASKEVDRNEFKSFVSPILERNKFIQALEWIPRVSKNQRIEYENFAKKEGISSFQFTEKHPDGTMVRAGIRPEYFPVYFVEPLIGNEAALGFDLASNPKRLNSMVESRDSGRIVASEKISLVQKENEKAGVLVFTPFYGKPGIPESIEKRKEGILGYFLGVYSLNDMFGKIFSPYLKEGMNLTVFEGKEISEPSILFGRYQNDSQIEQKYDIDFFGRKWVIVSQGGKNFHGGIKDDIPFAIAIGTFIIFLLASIIFQLNHSKTRKVKQEVSFQTHEILENQAKIKAVVEHVLDGIITINEQGIIESLNPAAERLFSYSSSETIGKNVNILMPEPYASEHDQHLKNYINTGESKIIGVGRKVEGLRKDGSTFPLDLGVSEMFIGETRKFIGIVHDVTEQKEASEKIEQAKKLNQLILDSAGEGIYGLDLEGKTTFANPAAEKMLGYTEEELLGKVHHNLIHHTKPDESPYPMEDCHIYASINDGRVHRESNEVFWRKDGNPIPVEYVSKPIKENNKIVGAVVTFSNIAERRRSEKIINDYTNSLKNANDKLFKSNKELDDFAYIISHDLKEPLRGIYNYSTFVKEDYFDKLDDDGKSKLDTLIRLSQRMESLIDSILYYSRLGRDLDIANSVDINNVLTDTLENMETLIKENKVDVRMAKNFPTVLGNETRIAEVFQNLIANAIKYNDKPEKWVDIGYFVEEDGKSSDDKIELESKKSQNGSNSLPVFYVKDNGIGILEKHFESLFRIFKRLNGRKKFSDGTGAGTTIVKKIVEQHNGKIWLESEIGEGTTFYFTLGGNTNNGKN